MVIDPKEPKKYEHINGNPVEQIIVQPDGSLFIIVKNSAGHRYTCKPENVRLKKLKPGSVYVALMQREDGVQYSLSSTVSKHLDESVRSYTNKNIYADKLIGIKKVDFDVSDEASK